MTIGAEFARDGVVKLPGTGLSGAQLDAITESLRAANPGGARWSTGGVEYFPDRIMDAWIVNPHVRALALAPQILGTLETLFGRRPLAFQTLNFNYGTEQDAHCDAIHFNSDPEGFLCAVWVALEDIDEGNGPVYYYPASHRMAQVGIASVEDGTVFDDAYSAELEQSARRSGLTARPALLGRGEALIWAGSVIHGGAAVTTPGRTRRSQVTHYFFEGCRYWVPKLSRADAIHWRQPRWIGLPVRLTPRGERRPLRVLCTTQPGAGHLLPMVGVLRELIGRGHQVRVASAASLAGLTAIYGLSFTPVGPNFTVGDEPRLVPELARARERRDRGFPYTRKVLVETLARAALADTARLVRHWRPDIVIRDPVEFAGLAVAEAAGLPHVTGRENRFLSPAAWRRELRGSIAALGRAAGADGLAADSLYRYLGLAPALPTFVAAAAVLPDPREFGAHVSSAMRFMRPRTPRRTPGRTPGSAGPRVRDAVLITFGTVYGSEEDLRAAAAATQGLPWPVISPGQRWLDLDDVLPRCAVVVTVGGFGTIMAALRYGIPLVVIPAGADHPTNAARCSALGVGVVVERGQLSGAVLRAAIERVAGDPAFSARAAELATEWASLPDVNWAAEQVEELAWTRQGG